MLSLCTRKPVAVTVNNVKTGKEGERAWLNVEDVNFKLFFIYRLQLKLFV